MDISEQEREERSRQREIAQGFNPDEPANEFCGCFTLAEAKESLFGSTRYKPKPVYLTDEDKGVHLPVVIDLARPKFIDSVEDGDMPDWYFEGWILDPGTPGVDRVRIFVSTMNYDEELHDDDFFTWQKITETELSHSRTLVHWV